MSLPKTILYQRLESLEKSYLVPWMTEMKNIALEIAKRALDDYKAKRFESLKRWFPTETALFIQSSRDMFSRVKYVFYNVSRELNVWSVFRADKVCINELQELIKELEDQTNISE